MHHFKLTAREGPHLPLPSAPCAISRPEGERARRRERRWRRRASRPRRVARRAEVVRRVPPPPAPHGKVLGRETVLADRRRGAAHRHPGDPPAGDARVLLLVLLPVHEAPGVARVRHHGGPRRPADPTDPTEDPTDPAENPTDPTDPSDPSACGPPWQHVHLSAPSVARNPRGMPAPATVPPGPLRTKHREQSMRATRRTFQLPAVLAPPHTHPPGRASTRLGTGRPPGVCLGAGQSAGGARGAF